MDVSVIRSDALPRLAWCAVTGGPDNRVVIHAGPHVEARKNGIVEGAWSGRFEDFEFAEAATFTGTGVVVEGGKAVFSTPTHTVAPLYSIRKNASLIISNSLPFLLAYSGEFLDPHYPFYDHDIMSIMFGLDAFVKQIPTRDGSEITLHYMETISVDSEGGMETILKPPPERFSSFDAYYKFLQAETRAVAENAADPMRGVRYTPLATISSGYDSPACAVLSLGCGCDRAITLTEARSDFADTDDSGKKIADVLGLDVLELSKADYFHEGQEHCEKEILATGYGGDDIFWIGAEAHLRGKLLFTGYHGDKVWDKDPHAASEQIKRGDPSGSSILEFRLRVGFINFPIPFIGCQRHPDIQAVSVSDEMSEWRIGGTYDRPIPRRMVEEKGVDRELFGQTKKAVALPYQTTGSDNPELDEVLSKRSLQEFRSYLQDENITSNSQRSSGLPIAARLINSHKLFKTASWLGFGKTFQLYKWRHQKPISDHNFLTAWAANALRMTYSAGIDAQ